MNGPPDQLDDSALIQGQTCAIKHDADSEHPHADAENVDQNIRDDLSGHSSVDSDGIPVNLSAENKIDAITDILDKIPKKGHKMKEYKRRL